ncbi:MAG: GAF domain-containing protein [Anaerolineales bacterium]|nr:GAF domain-containing protein [Anaerolineales bacterium]
MTPPRRSLLPLLGLLAFLGLLSAINLARDLGQPFGALHVYRNQAENDWRIEASTPPWWEVIAQLGLRYDDVLLALNGQPYSTNARAVFAQTAQNGAATLPLTVQRGGDKITFNLPVENFSLNQWLDLKLPDLINAFGFWLLAVAVYVARPQEPVNRAFAIAFGLVAATLALTLEGLFPEGDVLTASLRVAWAVAVSFLAAGLLHFSALFPVASRRLTPRFIRMAYVASGLMAVLYAGTFILHFAGVRTSGVYVVMALGFRLTLGALGVAVLYAIARLMHLYFRPASTPRLKRQLGFLLASLLFALPFVAVIVARTLTAGSQSFFWLQLDLRYLALAVPLAFAFVILRFQTFHSAHPVLLVVAIVASSALVASLGTALLRTALPQLASLTSGSAFFVIFIMALIVGSFWSTQRSWQGSFNQLFRLERGTYAAAREVGQQLITRIEASTLPASIAKALVEKLEVSRAAVWQSTAAGNFQLAAQAGALAETPLPAQLPAVPSHAAHTPFRPWAANTPDLAEIRALFNAPRSQTSIEVLAPLWAGGELLGWLGLGARSDDDIFDEADLSVIELVAQQAALFLLAAQQVEQLKLVPNQLAAAEERERLRIAQELHDTTQQFLGRLPFYLHVSRSAVRAKPEEAESLLARAIDEVEGAAQTLRQIRLNLAPPQLAHSLHTPLETLIENFRTRTQLIVHAEIPAGFDSALSTEARLALYRVVQQALDNAAAHAQAKTVTITFAPQAERLTFSIQDDGRGFSPADAENAQARGSFGLISMRARLTALGGELEITSAPGEGTKVRGWV